MKKRWIAAWTAALFTVSSAAVFADVEVTPISTIEDGDWVYGGSSLLKVGGRNGYALADLNGNLLTEDIYGWNFDYSHGYIVTATVEGEVNTSGALNLEGEEVIPFKYGDVKILSTEWALGYVLAEATADNYDYTSWGSNDKYYLIDTVDVYHLSDAVCLASIPRSEFSDASVVGHSLNIKNRSDGIVTTYDAQFNELGTGLSYTSDDEYAQMDYVTYRENGQTGLKDGEGNILITPAFQYMESVRRGYVEVDTGEKKGLMDIRGNLVIPAEYDDIEYSYYLPADDFDDTYGYNCFGYFCVIKDGKMGYVDATGTVTCEPKYSENILENHGASATYTDMEGKVHILAADGRDTALETAYQSMYAAYGAAGLLYTVNNADYKTGLIDWHGNILFPCEYSDISLSPDGAYLMVQKDYRDPIEIYKVVYGFDKVSAETPEETDESAGDPIESSEAGENTASVDLTEVLTLLKQDAVANQAQIVELLNSAAATLEADNVGVSTILKNAAVLLESDAAANGDCVRELVVAAADMLELENGWR